MLFTQWRLTCTILIPIGRPSDVSRIRIRTVFEPHSGHPIPTHYGCPMDIRISKRTSFGLPSDEAVLCGMRQQQPELQLQVQRVWPMAFVHWLTSIHFMPSVTHALMHPSVLLDSTAADSNVWLIKAAPHHQCQCQMTAHSCSCNWTSVEHNACLSIRQRVSYALGEETIIVLPFFLYWIRDIRCAPN